MATLHSLRPNQKKKNRKRVGRGNASGSGTYSGRGLKGQRSRSGGKSGLKRRGLKQYLLQIPKVRGFNRTSNIAGVNLGTLSDAFAEGQHVTPKILMSKGLIPRGAQVKILAGGKLTKKLSITAHSISVSAKTAIEKAGGSFRKL